MRPLCLSPSPFSTLSLERMCTENVVQFDIYGVKRNPKLPLDFSMVFSLTAVLTGCLEILFFQIFTYLHVCFVNEYILLLAGVGFQLF